MPGSGRPLPRWRLWWRRTRQIGLSLVLVAEVALLAWASSVPAPSFHRLGDLSPQVLDRSGALMRAGLSESGHWRFAADVSRIDPLYLNLLMAWEDKRFRSHPGVDGLAVARAVHQALAHRRIVSGASTLTMQTAKLLDPKPRTLSSKLTEMVQAVRLEALLSKDQILDVYLTLAPFGGNLEGVEAASWAWLGKPPQHLSLAEAALLVALPQAPSSRRPDRYPERAREARDRILDRAVEAGLATRAQAEGAKATPIPTQRQDVPVLAAQETERLLTAGRRRRTTLDAGLQARVEDLLRRRVHAIAPRINGAVVVMDHRTGAVRVAAGSTGYYEPGRQGMNDFTRAIRSPGSTLKPLLYGLAMQDGLIHPHTLIEDRRRDYDGYDPGNFDGDFHGVVTIETALHLSLNTPSVAVLERYGPRRFAGRLRAAGVTPSILGGRAGLPIILGGVGLRLVDLVHLYSALGRGDGRTVSPTTDPDTPPVLRSLMSAKAATTVRAMLATAPRPPGFAAVGSAPARQQLAFKTGTSYGYRDAWAIGSLGHVTVGVWVGDPSGETCPACSGLLTAAPLLLAVLDLLPPDWLAADPAPVATYLADPVPAAVRRFDQPIGTHAQAAPRLLFPVDGQVLDPSGRRGFRLPLEILGGALPLTVFLNDQPVARVALGLPPPVLALPPVGFAQIRVVAADGQSDRARIRITPADP